VVNNGQAGRGAPLIMLPIEVTLEIKTWSEHWCAVTLLGPYSPKCVEGEFSELRELGVLGSSHSPGPTSMGDPESG
jgi:hypothetical protein